MTPFVLEVLSQSANLKHFAYFPVGLLEIHLFARKYVKGLPKMHRRFGVQMLGKE